MPVLWYVILKYIRNKTWNFFWKISSSLGDTAYLASTFFFKNYHFEFLWPIIFWGQCINMGFWFYSDHLGVWECLSIKKSMLTRWPRLKYWSKLAKFLKNWNFQIKFRQDTKYLTWIFLFRNVVLYVFFHLE